MIVGSKCYIANVGDSRAVFSTRQGSKSSIQAVSRDHKPCDEGEKARIIEAGGQIYQTATTITSGAKARGDQEAFKEMIVGPQRVLPGRLSVCRTFGDIEAKAAALGGNPNVVIAVPEIKVVDLGPQAEFLVMGSKNFSLSNLFTR